LSAGGFLIGAALIGCGSDGSNEAGAGMGVLNGSISARDAGSDSSTRGVPIPVVPGLDGVDGMTFIQDNPDAPNVIAFHPSNVSAELLTVEPCGTPDFFYQHVMHVDGIYSPTQKTVPNNFTITMKDPGPAAGVAEMLTVSPVSQAATCGDKTGQNARAPDGTVDFSYDQCGDPNEIDPGAFDAVTITVVAMPANDGDQMSIDLQIHFVDGKILADTFSAPLVLQTGMCVPV
jgi:hypothetical protein